MPTGDEIQRYLSGAWRLMMGKPDGLKLLDLSADGFWNSFFAIVVALPAMFVGWVGVANGFGVGAEELGGRVSILIRLAIIDMAAWIVPLIALAFVMRAAGIADRYVPLVVASNWGSAISAWLMLPLSIAEVFAPGGSQLTDALALVLFLVILALSWRLTNAAINKGAGMATAVFMIVLILSFFLVFWLQGALGLMAFDQLPIG